jgi:hypothetical protein
MICHLVKYLMGARKSKAPILKTLQHRWIDCGGFAVINKPAVSVYHNHVDLMTLTCILEIMAAGGTSIAHLKELSKGLEY